MWVKEIRFRGALRPIGKLPKAASSDPEIPEIASISLLTKPVAAPHLVLQLFQQEGHGLAVEVPRRRGHRRVEVGVSVHPDDTEVRTLLGVAPHRPDTQTGKGGASSASATRRSLWPAPCAEIS